MRFYLPQDLAEDSCIFFNPSLVDGVAMEPDKADS
jgi:hypothetical protein